MEENMGTIGASNFMTQLKMVWLKVWNKELVNYDYKYLFIIFYNSKLLDISYKSNNFYYKRQNEKYCKQNYLRK
jgi:hypothetical protein